jgi:signal transduction histidine kinase/HAMP domain-containing protein
MRFRDRPIEQKIFLTILPICLLPSLVFLGLVVVGLRVTFERAMGSELERTAANLAENFDRFLDQHTAALRSRLYMASGSTDSLTSLTTLLHQGALCGAVVQLQPNPLGKAQIKIAVLEPGLEPLRNLLSRETGFFNEWLTRQSQIPGEGLVIDRLLAGNEQELGRLVLYLVPNEGGGLTLFVDTTHRFLMRFRQSLANPPDELLVFSSNLFPVESRAALSTEMNNAIRNALRRSALRNDSFPISADGRQLLMASGESQRMKRQHGNLLPVTWVFLVQYDLEVFLGPQDTLIWLAIILALVLVLALLGVAVVSARWLVSPLHTLRAQAEALAGGKLDVQVSITSRDEVGKVAEAFNIMATRLRNSYVTLEDRLEENRLHTEHIYVLNQVTNAIIQALSLDRIFEILGDELEKICEYNAIWIALLDRDGEDLSVAHIQPGGMITLFERGRIPFARSLHGRVVATRETLHAEISAQHSAEFFETQIFDAEGLQSFLIAPLPGRDGIIGTLTLAASQPDAYTEELAAVITSLANTVAVAIEQTTLFQQISHMATELERKVAERTEELRRATRKLIQTEKYFATGRMAGNLGHEINNPLGIIKNYLALVKGQMQRADGGRRKTDPSLEHIQVIDEEVNRIARLVRQLLDLHRPVEHKVQPIDLNALLDDIVLLLEESLKRSGIVIERDFDQQLPWPVASADLLRQVFINLLRNAQDAMEGPGGTLRLRTSSVVQWEAGHELQVVRIRISDTGCGISPENLSQIFDPFFTTKPSEKGSGLGLCVSFGIIRMYRGTIDVESTPGQGTAMTVSLPILERQIEGAEPPAPTLDPDPAILW